MKKVILILTVVFSLYACKDTANEAKVVEDDKQMVIDSMNVVLEKQKVELAKQKSIESIQAIENN